MAESGGHGAEHLAWQGPPWSAGSTLSSEAWVLSEAGREPARSQSLPDAPTRHADNAAVPAGADPDTGARTRGEAGLASGRCGTHVGGYNRNPKIGKRIPKSYKHEIYFSLICCFKPLKKWVSMLKQGKHSEH